MNEQINGDGLNAAGAGETPLQPALIIGLGGTGADVLMRLRRLLVDRFKNMGNIPIVKFLYIDTDPDWWNSQGSKVEESIRLGEDERLDAAITDTKALYDNIESGNAPHLDWYSLDSLKSWTYIGKGAGAVRQLGRFCVAYHAREIEDRMRKLLNAVAAEDAVASMNAKHNVQVASGVNVFVVAGLAGGTGSGMFLDIAYLARQVGASYGDCLTAGYLFLPGAYEDTDRSGALSKGYAALKELNYYTYSHAPDKPLALLYGEPVWDVDYSGDETQRIHFKNASPFDYTYLLDSSNAYANVDRKNIAAMVAESLFHEFTLSFATRKRSLRNNIRQHIVGHDGRDMPVQFMSFGQSMIAFPRAEVKEVLSYQLALNAVQRWIDKQAQPITVTADASDDDEATAMKKTRETVKVLSESDTIKKAVGSHITRVLKGQFSLSVPGLVVSIATQHGVRLTDKPAALREEVKEQWVAEKWEYTAFIGRVTETFRQWKVDFDDENSDRQQWGQYMQMLDSNRQVNLQNLKKRLEDELFSMFENAATYGPAWAVCTASRLVSYLTQLRKDLLDVANDANAVANLLEDVFLINATSGGGQSLSAVIEGKIGQELKNLRDVVDKFQVFHKRDQVEKAAERYLIWCSLWCRAKVEERVRRLAEELAKDLSDFLGEMERRLLDRAETLAGIKVKMQAVATEWAQKAAKSESNGRVLFDPVILGVLEAKIRTSRGGLYDPDKVANDALTKMGVSLRDLDGSQADDLIRHLVDEARNAVGNLDETGLTNTDFAAHDLLMSQAQSVQALDAYIGKAIDLSDPYVKLVPPPGGGWAPAQVTRKAVAGIRGGVIPSDADAERVSVIQSLGRKAWDTAHGVYALEDSSQIIFFQELGGFPLRALSDFKDMKKAYEDHRRTKPGIPLHIVRDEMAVIYPDLEPPAVTLVSRARTAQLIGTILGIITEVDMEARPGSTHTVHKYVYTYIHPTTGRQKNEELSESQEGVLKVLMSDEDKLNKIELALSQKVDGVDETAKNSAAQLLTQFLDDLETRIRSERSGIDPSNTQVFKEHDDCITKFMDAHGLKVTPTSGP